MSMPSDRRTSFCQLSVWRSESRRTQLLEHLENGVAVRLAKAANNRRTPGRYRVVENRSKIRQDLECGVSTFDSQTATVFQKML